MSGDGFPSIADGPSPHVYQVTPADSDLTKPVRALDITTAGNLKVTCLNGAAETMAVRAGQFIPGVFTRVWATGTTATGIIAYE